MHGRLETGPWLRLCSDFTPAYAAVDDPPQRRARQTEGAIPKEGAFLAFPVRGPAAAMLT